MRRALIKKQFLEMNRNLFYDRKTGAERSIGKVVLYILIFVFSFSCVFLMFLGMDALIGSSLLPLGLDWLYYSMVGMTAILLGIFGSTFSTYSSLFKAKDNELLLSMPIMPKDILFVRMSSVFTMSALYSAIAWIPSVIMAKIMGYANAKSVPFGIILMILIALLVLALTCLVGWLVALISTRVTGKFKTILIVVFSLIFFAFYYFVCFRMNAILNGLVAQSEAIGKAVKGWIYPIYQLGLAASGDIKALIIFALISIAAAVVCYMAMSRSFIKIVTSNRGDKKIEYKQKTTKLSTTGQALLRKEMSRFTTSSTYMLNAGLGIIMMIVVGIIALIKASALRSYIDMLGAMSTVFADIIPILVAGVICMMLSMNAITTPSISLEGKNLWILRSMPVKAADVLMAKARLGIVLNTIPTVISVVLISIACGFSVTSTIFVLLLTENFVLVTSYFGLILGLRRPNLTWTNESVPIKQSLSVMIVMFGGWVVSIAMMGLGLLAVNFISVDIYIIIMAVLLCLVYKLLNKWLLTRGCEIFDSL